MCVLCHGNRLGDGRDITRAVEVVKAKETYGHMDINVNDFQLKMKGCF